MDIILLGITIVSLIVALVMSVTAWRVMRDEKQRSAARVAALSVAASANDADSEPPVVKAPWASPSRPATQAPVAALKATSAEPARAPELPLNQRRAPERFETESIVTHATGFLGASEVQRDSGGRQKTLAFAAIVFFLVLSGGLVWMMSGPRGTAAVAMGPNAPLELVSLTHERKQAKLAVSGLVRNPVAGSPVERLSAVVFLFDAGGTFVTSSRANVDFLKLGAGDESPFVVSLDAPPTVSRYRVSFRTDDGVVPHVDRRDAGPATEGGQPVNVTMK
ncbi:MAG TPA: hypothetical protein VEA16_19740 [Vicinamibacterales bacterium]|nr:hypothetical protein [Vicinamibacterales bacterium]